MANPTTNYGWVMPTSTDLVTDLPADFAVFGQAVDTSMADLKGGTTGQILAKATNTDMDFTWIANDQGDITAVTAGTGISGGGTSGAVTVTNSMATTIDAKGDLVPGTGADTFARLAVGANNTVLVADSAAATGLKYQGTWTSYTPTLQSITLGNGTLVGKYQQVGNLVFVVVTLDFGSTTTIATFPRFSLPVTAELYSGNILGGAQLTDAGVVNYAGIVAMEDANNVQIYCQKSSTNHIQYDFIGGTTPFTWTTSDKIWFQISYKAA
jgi:hypothetical protein